MFDLNEEQLAIRDMAREFARNEILPGAPARDHSGEFPADIVAKLGELGLMGVFVPTEYGGSGLDYLSYVLALEEVCYADAGVGIVMSVQNSLAGWPILTFGTHAQKEKYLAPLARGEVIGCYALTEPSAGSDAAALKTKATPTATGWRLDGTKMWITNGPQAATCVTYATTDLALRHKGINAYIVEKAYPGFAVGKIEEKMGIHCSGTSELIFDGMDVPTENLLHEPGKGFSVAMATLDGGRIGVAAQALGIAQRALDLSVGHANQRLAFGKPISALQGIQFKIADMRARIESARLMTWKAAAMRSAGHAASAECSMAKLLASETANFCAYEAVQIFGGYGFSREYEVERLYRDARITTLYEGTSEIQRVVIARHTLGG